MELLACSRMTFYIIGFIVSCSGVLNRSSLSKNHFQGHIDHWEPHVINCLIIPIGTLWFMWEVQYVSVVYVRSAVCVSGLCEKCSMCQWFMWEVQYVSVVYVRSAVCVSGLCEKCSMCQWFMWEVQYVSVVYVRSSVCVSGLCEKFSMCQWFMWEVQYVSVVYYSYKGL